MELTQWYQTSQTRRAPSIIVDRAEMLRQVSFCTKFYWYVFFLYKCCHLFYRKVMVLATSVLTLFFWKYILTSGGERDHKVFTRRTNPAGRQQAVRVSLFLPKISDIKFYPNKYICCYFLTDKKGIDFSNFYSHTLRCQSGGEDVTAPLNIW